MGPLTMAIVFAVQFLVQFTNKNTLMNDKSVFLLSGAIFCFLNSVLSTLLAILRLLSYVFVPLLQTLQGNNELY